MTLNSDMSLDTLLGLTSRMLGDASHVCLQLVDRYRGCKTSPTLCWDDPNIRRHLMLSTMLLVDISCLALFYFVLTSHARTKRAQKVADAEKNGKRIVLQKLLAVITPTRSIWSERYWELAHTAIKSQLLRLPTRVLIEDLIKGDVELRNPQADLPNLIIGRTVVDGLQVELESEHASQTRVRSTLYAPLKVKTLLCGTQPSGTNTVEYLDRIKPDDLLTFAREFQLSIQAGSTAMLGFSAHGRRFPASENDSLYNLAALPFLPRQHIPPSTRSSASGSTPAIPRSSLRTTIPLKTTLDNVVFLLSSGSEPLTIKSIYNVSDEYAIHLDQHADHLFTDELARTKFQQTWGTEAWREERILATWEAALIKAEVLTRWVVVVERRG